MRSNALLVFLIVTGSALCWWPLLIEPSLDFAWWIPLLCVALCTGLAMLLSQKRSLPGTLASTMGALGGLCIGCTIWPPHNPIARPWMPYYVAAMTIATAVVSFVSGHTARRVSFPGTHRTVLWIALLGVISFGPVALALTPPLVKHRMRENERIAAERFAALRDAVKRTAAEDRDAKHLCDGGALRQRYAGPPFSEEDWRRITGNYVQQNGYFFMVYCQEQGGYMIDAGPARAGIDGRRRFCVDGSGHLGCGMEWNGSHACASCTK